MDYSDELRKLVIRNMEIIQAAPAVVEDTEKILFDVINTRVKEAVNAKKKWKGVYSLVTDKDSGEITFAPESWLVLEDESYGAYYTLEEYSLLNEPTKDIHWLSCATGAKNSALCFAFKVEKGWSDWAIKEHNNNFEKFYTDNIGLLQKARFDLVPSLEPNKSGKRIIRPFKFEAEKLAAECPGFDEGALTPLDDALKNLFEVHKEFDSFVASIKR